MTIKKRGRPAGSKNKPVVKRSQVLTFEKQLEEWEKKENAVNYKELSEKLQEALAKSYCDYEQLEKTNKALIMEMNRQSCIIDYLEGRLR